MKKKILAILPVSIGGRLTTNSIIDGYRQNNCEVTVFDELFDKNLDEILKNDFDQIVGYDFSPLKINISNTFLLLSSHKPFLLTSYTCFFPQKKINSNLFIL